MDKTQHTLHRAIVEGIEKSDSEIDVNISAQKLMCRILKIVHKELSDLEDFDAYKEGGIPVSDLFESKHLVYII